MLKYAYEILTLNSMMKLPGDLQYKAGVYISQNTMVVGGWLLGKKLKLRDRVWGKR